MNTLDRYVLSAFLKNYFISLFVLIGLFVVLDMVFNFDEFAVQRSVGVDQGVSSGGVASAAELAGAIGSYYFYQAFRVFNQLAGVIPVVAAAFTFVRLSRNNELSAILAAGVPLLRLATPVILAAVALNLVLVPINQELIVPRMAERITQDRGEAAGRRRGFEINPLADDDGRMLVGGRFLPSGAAGGSGAAIVSPTFLETDAAFRPTALAVADRADWDAAAHAWRLTRGERTERLAVGRGEAVPIDAYPGTIGPAQIALARSGEYVDLLSTRRINDLLARPRGDSVADLLRVKHARFAAPVVNVILVLLAIPAVLTREPGQLRHAAATCFVLVGLCMGTVFVSQQFATRPPSDLADPAWADRWPALLAWVPIFVFGPAAVWLLDRVKS